MKKEFIPYNLTLQLKELGFDEDCLSHSVSITDASGTRWTSVLKAPLYQQAFRFFREKYDIHYSINRECSQHDHKWGYNWSLYNYSGLFHEYLTSHPNAPAGEWVYQTYEDAELACLKEIIEIVKTK
jgi:hypothetical protein